MFPALQSKKETTILLVTHDAKVAARADSVFVLYGILE